LGPEVTPIEAGLAFTCCWDKPGGFNGLEALLRQKDAGGPTRRVLIITLEDEGGKTYVWGDEPVLLDGEIVGRVTSAGYGQSVGKSVCLASISHPDVMSKGFTKRGEWTVNANGVSVQAKARLTGPYDHKNVRIRQ
jgi:glycine cleavage system aminomethyltransferase T